MNKSERPKIGTYIAVSACFCRLAFQGNYKLAGLRAHFRPF